MQSANASSMEARRAAELAPKRSALSARHESAPVPSGRRKEKKAGQKACPTASTRSLSALGDLSAFAELSHALQGSEGHPSGGHKRSFQDMLRAATADASPLDTLLGRASKRCKGSDVRSTPWA